MDIVSSIEPVSVLKTKSAQLIRKARESKRPIVITTNGRPSAVLLDVDSYEQQRRSLLLLKIISQGDQDYRKKGGVSHGKAKKHFQKTLQKFRQGL